MKAAAQYWENLGPGLTTGAADDDPSGIATYSQAGAKFGFGFLWTALFTFPLMGTIQEMCARIGLVTGRGLAGNIKKHFPKKVIYLTSLSLFFANTFNIGANLGAMSEALRLLLPQANFYILVVAFAVFSLLLQILLSYASYARYLKWLALVLFAYIFSALSLNLDWSEIFKATLKPSLITSADGIIMLCAIFGTTISPYLFFWQSSQEVEEEILAGKTTIQLRSSETKSEDIARMRTDVWSGMFFSNFVMFFIMITCGVVLFKSGINNVETASQAAEALKPLAGKWAYLLFTVGIVGTGLLAVPVLAGGAAYALAESFNWRQGLYKKFSGAKKFYYTIIAGMTLGAALNFFGLNPIKALIYSAVINGLVAPVVLIQIVKISSDKKIMGNWQNNRFISTLGWITCIIMILAGVAAIAALIVT
ncbi:MAG: Nramp family divalent metal transporter [Candidatus Doudnabacteria bacterium]|nr:Nramp family divalent metal transporter [Candidatus Doudnabacteria bacterium]